jgi:hypothetical protein
LEELDVEGGDDDVLEHLADLGVAEEVPDHGVEVLAVVLGSQNDAVKKAYRTAAAHITTHDTKQLDQTFTASTERLILC